VIGAAASLTGEISVDDKSNGAFRGFLLKIDNSLAIGLKTGYDLSNQSSPVL